MRSPLSLAARRIAVVAPHPDDEALGCGGLVAALAGDDRVFRVVFVTDGGASHPGSRLWPRDRLAAARRAEACGALRELGLGDEAALFLDLPDAAMPGLETPRGQAAVTELAEALRAFNPDLVLLPWRRDPHCDHRDAWTLATAALSRAGLSPDTLEYAVWLDEIGGEMDRPRSGEAQRIDFDIAAGLAAKRRAVMAHRTQTTDLIDDDPSAFRLGAATLDRLIGPVETYWRPL